MPRTLRKDKLVEAGTAGPRRISFCGAFAFSPTNCVYPVSKSRFRGPSSRLIP